MADIRVSGLIDDFARSEDPILPPWRTLPNMPWLSGIANFSYGPNDAFSVVSGNWWETRYFGGDCEIWARLGEGADITEAYGFGLFAEPYGNPDGYLALWGEAVSGGGFHGLRRYDNGGFVDLAGGSGQLGAGDLALLRLRASDVEVWRSTNNGADWTLLMNAIDNTYRNYLYPIMRVDSDDSAGPVWSYVGGGEEPGNFIRWINQ